MRGTVRSQAKGQEVRETLAQASVDTNQLTLVELDLTSDRGWNDAAAGCNFVMHVASPFIAANPKDPQEVISPAVDGTLQVLRAAKKVGAKRIALTSSIMSMMGSMKTGTFTTNDYKDRVHLAYLRNIYSQPPVVQYFQAKGVKVDQERYALSELLQWIFRSAIREQENVSLYLPSKRMRQLLHEWSGGLCQV